MTTPPPASGRPPDQDGREPSAPTTPTAGTAGSATDPPGAAAAGAVGVAEEVAAASAAGAVGVAEEVAAASAAGAVGVAGDGTEVGGADVDAAGAVGVAGDGAEVGGADMDAARVVGPAAGTGAGVADAGVAAATEATVSMPSLVPGAAQEPTVPLRRVPRPAGEPVTVIMSRIPPADEDPDRPRTPVTELARAAAQRRRRPSPRRAAPGEAGPGAAGVPPRPASPRRLRIRLAALDGRILPPIADTLVGLGRGARRARSVTAVAALVCFALALVAVYKVARTPPVTPPGAVATPTVSPYLRVGVANGEWIPAYVETTRQRLKQALDAPGGGERYALVSFGDYLKPARAATALAGVQMLSVFMRVQPRDGWNPPSRNPEAESPTDIVKVMLAEADQDQQSAADDRYKLSIVPSDSPDRGRLRDTYQYLAGLESMEQQEYSSLCACVYGAVIRASPAMLRTLAGRAGVRAVDVVPADRDPDLSVFSPPVPDQSGVATLPPG